MRGAAPAPPNKLVEGHCNYYYFCGLVAKLSLENSTKRERESLPEGSGESMREENNSFHQPLGLAVPALRSLIT